MQKSTPWGRTALWLLTAVLLIAAPAALVLTLRGGEHGDHASTPGTSSSTADPALTDVGMEHIHGLGVDPADGRLYAATHFGVFVVDENGTATRVGNMQDTMGFAIAGPNTFLASGHPDFTEDEEPLMGLIESRDAGRTWQPLSLRGQADFHALQVTGERVWGFDSTTGRLMITTDRRSWTTLSRLPLTDFAVGADERVVVGATDETVLRSEDGGRNWTAVPGAPALRAVDPAADGFVAVDAEGIVHSSIDGGRTWTARGALDGTPAAITVVDDGQSVYVATTDTRILVSHDRGVTFSVLWTA